MTLKHIRFGESEVMRELERRAVRKGQFDPTPEELVRAAVAKKKEQLTPSDDLFSDMLRLADGLRKKGFNKQAAEIEQNLIVLKKAEVQLNTITKEAAPHLYNVHDESGDDLLDFAHSDGDVSVADASNEYGKVETTQSAHKKMLAVINKQPGGKLSDAAARIISAQVADPKAGDPNYRGIEGEVNKHLATANAARTQAVNEYVKFFNAVNPKDNQRYIYFTPNRVTSVPAIRSLFEQLGGDAAAINSVQSEIGFYYGNGPETPDSLSRTLTGMGGGRYDDFMARLNQLRPDLAPHFQRHGAIVAVHNREAVANELHKSLQQLKNQKLKPAIDAANKTLIGALQNSINKFNSIDLSEVGIRDEREAYAASGKLQRASDAVNKLVETITMSKSLLEPFGAYSDVMTKALTQIDSSVDAASSVISRAVGGPIAQIIRDPQVVVTRFMRAANIYKRFADATPTGDAKTLAEEAAALSSNLAEIAAGSKGRTFAYIYEDIKDAYPEIKSWAAFDKLSQDILTAARTETGIQHVPTEASYDSDDMVKVAAKLTGRVPSLKGKVQPKAAPAPAGGAPAKAPAETGAAKPQGNAPAQEAAPEKKKDEYVGYDMITRNLNSDTLENPKGYIEVSNKDLASVLDFYNFVYGNDIIAELARRRASDVVDERLLKVAARIKVAQVVDPWAGKEDPAAPAEAPSNAGGITGGELDAALRWMRQRAERVARSVGDDPEKLNKAREYKNAIHRLLGTWSILYNPSKHHDVVVTRDMITNAGGGRRDETGAAKQQYAPQYGGGQQYGGYVLPPPMEERAPLPFGNILRLDELDPWLVDTTGETVLDYRQFRGTPPTRFYQRTLSRDEYNDLIEGNLNFDPRIRLRTFLQKLYGAIDNRWREWSAEGHPDEVISQQSANRDKWLRAVDAMYKATERWIAQGARGLGNIKLKEPGKNKQDLLGY